MPVFLTIEISKLKKKRFSFCSMPHFHYLCIQKQETVITGLFMIYYFSATGNSKYVAERIGKAIGEEVCSIGSIPSGTRVHDENPFRHSPKQLLLLCGNLRSSAWSKRRGRTPSAGRQRHCPRCLFQRSHARELHTPLQRQ